MKQLIVLISMIMLGLFISGLIIGPSPTSIKSTLSNAWATELEYKDLNSNH